MQRGLSIKDNNIPVSNMSFNFVAWFDVRIGPILKHAEIDHFVVVPYDVESTRPVLRSILDKHFHFINIGIRDCFRNSDILSYSQRHPELF